MSLERAIASAVHLHSGQVDKGGHPYILHPIQVMLRVRAAGGSERQQIAAVLHDVIEDCEGVDLNDIDHYFGWRVRDLVDVLTKRRGEEYPAYIARVAENPEAVLVKIADLEENLRTDRGQPPMPAHRAKYKAAVERLNEAPRKAGA